MATKKAKTTKKAKQQEFSPVLAAFAILFGGVAVVSLGLLQGQDNVKLLLIGFGAALLVLGGVLIGLCTKPGKR